MFKLGLAGGAAGGGTGGGAGASTVAVAAALTGAAVVVGAAAAAAAGASAAAGGATRVGSCDRLAPGRFWVGMVGLVGVPVVVGVLPIRRFHRSARADRRRARSPAAWSGELMAASIGSASNRCQSGADRMQRCAPSCGAQNCDGLRPIPTMLQAKMTFSLRRRASSISASSSAPGFTQISAICFCSNSGSSRRPTSGCT